MATYTYTGKLTDFGEAPFPEATPKLWVIAETSAFGPSGPLAPRRIPVTVASNGNFSVELVASVDTVPSARYVLRVEWLHADDTVSGWADWAFTASIGGGPISEMGLIPVTRFWSGPLPPSNPGPGLWWLDTSAYPYVMKEWV